MNAYPAALIAALRQARHVAVLSGAGVSAESGVPTFRDAQSGLWAKFRPEDLATVEAYARNPPMVWAWYRERRAAIARVAPNPGHHALVALEARVPRFTLITQNVDGLHRLAGSRTVLELHGNIRKSKCFECGKPQQVTDQEERTPPPCDCGRSTCRPDVVWFGEMLPEEEIAAAQAAARDCDVFLTVGTSTQVYPAAELPFTAKRHGAYVIEVNPDETPFSRHADASLRGPSGVVLPTLLERMSD
jgi:NAD-dependent deacetylase